MASVTQARQGGHTTLFWRRSVQVAFVLLVLWRSIAHQIQESAVGSLDSICPFGGAETLWRIITVGKYTPKLHESNLVIGLGLLAVILVSGGVFCGWVCPLGSLQEWLFALGRRLKLPVVRASARTHRVLSWGRYVVLVAVLMLTAGTAKLWFADYDPFRTIFGLHWLFEPSWAQWIGYTIALLVLGAALVVERPWCAYACPLGGTTSLLQRLSLLKVRRTDTACIHCNLCTKACPARIDVAHTEAAGADCIGCLACIDACPRSAALGVELPHLPLRHENKKGVTRS